MYSSARKKAFTKRNIFADWIKGGLYPLNAQRVLKSLVKLMAKLQPMMDLREVLALFKMERLGSLQHSSPHSLASCDFILERDADALEETRKQSIQRHLQKLTKGAQTFISRRVLQQKRIEILLKINHKAKVRRATKSLVLGNARIMSYENLARAKRKLLKKMAEKMRKSCDGSANVKKTEGHARCSAFDGSRLINSGAYSFLLWRSASRAH